jgi:hypothetical protein
MPKINPERMTARPEGSFVVFLIGMRVNNAFAIHRWLPVFRAMPKMIIELYKNPQLGFKSQQSWFGRTTIMVQYWESAEKLIEYAKSADSAHLPAWRAFNRAAKSPAVGIWHETYVIDPGKSESVYKNMPTFGLGKVGPLQPAVGRLNSATERLSKPSED